jgi:transcriptional regulator with XRE-family HTH domain
MLDWFLYFLHECWGSPKLRGVTQKELGEACEVTTTTVSRWETGGSSPDRRAASVVRKIKNGDVSFGKKCLWCGTLHGTDVESELCKRSQATLRAQIQAADDEKVTLKASGMLANIRGRAVSTGTDLMASYCGLAESEGIHLRNAEEIMREVFAPDDPEGA